MYENELEIAAALRFNLDESEHEFAVALEELGHLIALSDKLTALYESIEQFGISQQIMKLADPAEELRDYIPSLEAYDTLPTTPVLEGNEATLEGLADLLKSLFDRIVGGLKKMLGSVGKAFERVHDMLFGNNFVPPKELLAKVQKLDEIDPTIFTTTKYTGHTAEDILFMAKDIGTIDGQYKSIGKTVDLVINVLNNGVKPEDSHEALVTCIDYFEKLLSIPACEKFVGVTSKCQKKGKEGPVIRFDYKSPYPKQNNQALAKYGIKNKADLIKIVQAFSKIYYDKNLWQYGAYNKQWADAVAASLDRIAQHPKNMKRNELMSYLCPRVYALLICTSRFTMNMWNLGVDMIFPTSHACHMVVRKAKGLVSTEKKKE